MADARRDEQLAGILAGMVEQARGGTHPDLEAAARAHPELAAELRELWAVAALADDFVSANGSQSAGLQGFPATLAGASPGHVGDLATLPAEFGDYELLERIG